MNQLLTQFYQIPLDVSYLFQLTRASYCFSRISETSVRMTSPIYSIIMVCFSKSRAAYNPNP